MATGSITGRVQSSGTDPWGRWSYLIMIGHNNRMVTIISAYQPVEASQDCRGSTARGTYTVSAQHQCLLLQSQDPLDNPRTAFRRDLRHFLTNQEKLGADLILLGDFNERMGDDPNGMSSINAEFRLVDIMANRHPTLTEPATYARGRKRLDFALGTHRVAAAIIAGGYEQFHFRFHTDHRAFYMDFSTDGLFGSPTQQLAKMAERGLHSRNVKQVTQYIAEKHQMLTASNAFARSNRLNIPGDRHRFAEKLDADVVSKSLSAENRTSKYKVPLWSKKLIAARTKVSILSKFLSMHKTGINLNKIISKEMKSLTTPFTMPHSLTECNTALRIAKKEVADIIEHSFEVREKERDQQIKALEEDYDPDNKKKAKILRNLKKAEEMRQLFQKLQILRNVRTNRGITRIEIPADPKEDPKTCTEWQTIDVPTDILQHLQNRNRTHFGQAHNTPFTQSPLADELGFSGATSTGEEILQGKYHELSSLAPPVQLLVTHLQRHEQQRDTTQPLQAKISEPDFVGKIQSWNESTSTSPSGLHLGHYKALVARHEYSELHPEDPLRIKWDQMQSDLRDIHLTLLNYALQRGYSYLRWQQVSNAMLFKEENNIKIHRTRVIHIYEADYNLAIGMQWRLALYQSEDLHLLNAGQYGSRPHRNAHDPIFIEEFQLEISRATRKSLVQINYDATSCYDRIIPNLAALVSRKFGVPQSVVLSNVTTLQKAQYRLKTELGTSKEYYQHDTTYPIYGTGQGSGNSPMIWCFLSSILFDCYETQAIGAVYEPPDRSSRTHIQMIGYVDDSNGQTNMFLQNHQPEDKSLIQQAMADAQIWHDVLWASGGALELPKCSYQILSWKFSPLGVPSLRKTVPDTPIKVFDITRQTSQQIPPIPAHMAHKTLGHYKDPAGNQHRQLEELQLKCDKAADFMAMSPLNRQEAWTYYFAIFLPSVGYPLSSCHFSVNSLDKVQRRAMANIFAKCGFNRHTKREVLYGPSVYGGANFRSLYSLQSTGQVTTFIKYWRSPCQAGQLLRHATAWAQYALGISTSFLTNVHNPLPHMEVKWLQSLRQYLHHINGSIELDKDYVPRTERLHDVYLMDCILHSEQFTAPEIRSLNYCRQYLQVVTLSDITKADGSHLDAYMMRGMLNRDSSQTKWHFFNQKRPPAGAWRLWKQANLLWSDGKGQLKQPLLHWLTSPKDQRRTWSHYQDSDYLLYARIPNHNTPAQYKVYFPTGSPAAHPDQEIAYITAIESDMIHALPDDAFPIEAQITASSRCKVRFHYHHYRTMFSTQATRRNEDFGQFIAMLDPWEEELLQYIHVHQGDMFSVVTSLLAGFVAASDGSVRYKTDGSFGWIISAIDGARLVSNYGPVRGAFPTSYRAEAYGLLSLLRFIVRALEYCQVIAPPDWKWTATSDNLSLVDVINGSTDDGISQVHLHDWTKWDATRPDHEDDDNAAATAALDNDQPNPTLEPDWDVLHEIQWTITHHVHGCTLVHTKGHQDDKAKYHTLSLLAQLNIDADKLAGQFQDCHGESRPQVLLFPHASAQVHIREGTITSRLPFRLRLAETGPPLQEYICRKNQWTQAEFDMINWPAHAAAIQAHNKQRIHITKKLHEALPTNYNIHRRNILRQQCPCCECGKEDHDHIIRCPSPARASWRAATMITLQESCHRIRTSPPMIKILSQGIHGWLQSEVALSTTDHPPKFHRLIRHQNTIGWRQIFHGRFALEWARHHDDYTCNATRNPTTIFPTGTRKRTGDQWCQDITTTLWAQWTVVWTLRNAVIHGKDEITRRERQEQEDLRRLRKLYSQRHLMEPRVQDLFFDSIIEHEQLSAHAIHNWLAIHVDLARMSMKQVTTRAIQGVPSIRQYFPSTKPQNSDAQVQISDEDTQPEIGTKQFAAHL